MEREESHLSLTEGLKLYHKILKPETAEQVRSVSSKHTSAKWRLTGQDECEVVSAVHHSDFTDRSAGVDAVVRSGQAGHLQPLVAEGHSLVAEHPQAVVEPLEPHLRAAVHLAAQHHLAALGQFLGRVGTLQLHPSLVTYP